MFGRSVPDQQGDETLGRWEQRDGRRKKRKRGPLPFVLQKEQSWGFRISEEKIGSGTVHECLS